MDDRVKKVGEIGQDNLIARLFPRALTFGLKVSAGEGKLVRGTVLALTEDGKYVVVGSATPGEGKTAPLASCILADDVDASGDEDAIAVAYGSGNFNPAAVTVAEGYELTVADKDNLRKCGIVFTQMLDG